MKGSVQAVINIQTKPGAVRTLSVVMTRLRLTDRPEPRPPAGQISSSSNTGEPPQHL